jgi:ABC-2 type transport system permease protein
MATQLREIQGIRVFVSSANFAIKALFSWLRPEMWLMQVLTLPLFQMAFFVYLATFVAPTTTNITFIAVGNAMQVASFSSIFAVCNLTSEEKWQGTLIPLIATPANRFPLFLGRAMFQILNGMATIAVGFLYANVVFGVDMSRTDFVALSLVIIITTFAMTGFGLMLGSVGLFMRTAMVIANIFLFIGLLVCGVNFPVSALPTWLQPLSYAIPMTYGTMAARAAVTGSSILGIAPILLQEVATGVGSILVGYLLFVGFEVLARRRGTLEEY